MCRDLLGSFPNEGYRRHKPSGFVSMVRPVLHISIVHSLQSGQKAERISIASRPFRSVGRHQIRRNVLRHTFSMVAEWSDS